MKLLAALLATVSLAAVSAASPSFAQQAGIVVDAAGSYVVGNSGTIEDRLVTDPGITDFDINDFDGGYGTLGLGYRFGNGWDISGRFSATSLNPSTADFFEPSTGFPFSDKAGEITSDLDFQGLDIEAGYAPVVDDGFDLRVFAGLRGLHYTNSLNETEDKVGGGFPSEADFDHEFIGVGPRIGMEFATRLGDSQFGLSGSFGGAVIFGSEDQTVTLTGPLGSPATTVTSEDKVVVNLDASLGLDYHLTEQATVTVGYRAEHLSGVNDFSGYASETGQLVHGPFLKLKAAF